MFSEEFGSGFVFCLRDALTRGLLLGLLGWREKRGFVSLLSESPLGQPLSPGVLGYGLTMRLSFLPTIPHPEPLKEARQRDRLVGGKRDEGMDGLPMTAIWECYGHLGCKIEECWLGT